jgi:hypothetical protein
MESLARFLADTSPSREGVDTIPGAEYAVAASSAASTYPSSSIRRPRIRWALHLFRFGNDRRGLLRLGLAVMPMIRAPWHS